MLSKINLMISNFFDHEFFHDGVFHHFVGDNITLLFVICAIVLTIIPYLLGSINFAIIISGKAFHDDVREHGSGNAGMTNMLRTYGKRAAALTLLGDAMKAMLAAIVGYYMLGQYGAYIAGFFCVLGHTFPIFFKFKGGKGVVTAAASVLMCNPLVFLILLVLFVTIVGIWRYISLGSIMCVLLYPVILNGVDIVLWNHPTRAYIIFAFLTSALIVIKHKDNIKRLLEGKENKFSLKK